MVFLRTSSRQSSRACLDAYSELFRSARTLGACDRGVPFGPHLQCFSSKAVRDGHGQSLEELPVQASAKTQGLRDSWSAIRDGVSVTARRRPAPVRTSGRHGLHLEALRACASTRRARTRGPCERHDSVQLGVPRLQCFSEASGPTKAPLPLSETTLEE